MIGFLVSDGFWISEKVSDSNGFGFGICHIPTFVYTLAIKALAKG